MARTTYAIGLGSNRWGLHGTPAAEVAAALVALAIGGARVTAVSPVMVTAPLGPSIRRYVNAAALVESDEDPAALLRRLKAIERSFGRRRGRRWGARVIDLDILLWSEGPWTSPGLTVPHRALRTRGFVLGPLVGIAPDWRDPVTGRSIRQLALLVDRRRPRP